MAHFPRRKWDCGRCWRGAFFDDPPKVSRRIFNYGRFLRQFREYRFYIFVREHSGCTSVPFINAQTFSTFLSNSNIITYIVSIWMNGVLFNAYAINFPLKRAWNVLFSCEYPALGYFRRAFLKPRKCYRWRVLRQILLFKFENSWCLRRTLSKL